jgi:hypothetical protein
MNTRLRLVKMAARLQLGIPKPPPPVSQPPAPENVPPPPPPPEPTEMPGMDYSRNMQQLLKTYGLKSAINPNKILKGLSDVQDISQYVDQPAPPPATQAPAPQ